MSTFLFALLQGCLSARGERILMVDADGATEITDIENLEKAMDGIAKDYVCYLWDIN